MSTFFHKLKGDGASLPVKPTKKNIVLAWIGGYIAVSALFVLDQSLDAMLLLGSYGASCLLVFGFPDLPFSQPRNLVLGHLLSAIVGLIVLVTCGSSWWSIALAVGTAIALMMSTRTVHPPAASNPVIIHLTQPGWSFLLFPILSGALLLLGIALIFNNLSRSDRYPKYW